MKHLLNLFLFIFIATGLVVFQSCQKDEVLVEDLNNAASDALLKKADKNRVFYGPTIPVGKGVARAWVRIDKQDNPVEVGLNLSHKAFEGLPGHHASFVLPFHKIKGKNFYDHVLLDWSPEGHEPDFVYTFPHFDVHFYITSVEERMAIGDTDYNPFIDDKYIPQDYIKLPGVIPQMGSHWADTTSAELSPPFAKFTHTMIIGSYNGFFTFWEPMVTLEFLLSKTDVKKMVKQPEAFQRDGWYPKYYEIYWTERPDECTIALTGLIRHEGQ